MPAQTILVRHTHFGLSGLPTDRYVNDFTVHKASTFSSGDASAVADAIEDKLYNNTTGTTAPIYDYLSSMIDRNTGLSRYDFFVRGAGGSPVFTVFRDPRGIGAVTDIPEQIAICLSFHADTTGVPEELPNPSPPPATIRPAASKRGRVYLGPINNGPVDQNNTTFVSSTCANDIAISASALLAELASLSLPWQVWSAKNGVGSDVIGGFVENRFDVQRRRAGDPTNRVTWS